MAPFKDPMSHFPRENVRRRAMPKYEAAARVLDEPFERTFTLADEPDGSLGRAPHLPNELST